MNKFVKSIEVPPPYTPADFSPLDITAVQALARGDADAKTQQRALKWIIERAALTYDLDYRPDSRDHAFASGRRFVGLEIVRMLKLDAGEVVKRQEELNK